MPFAKLGVLLFKFQCTNKLVNYKNFLMSNIYWASDIVKHFTFFFYVLQVDAGNIVGYHFCLNACISRCRRRRSYVFSAKDLCPHCLRIQKLWWCCSYISMNFIAFSRDSNLRLNGKQILTGAVAGLRRGITFFFIKSIIETHSFTCILCEMTMKFFFKHCS